MAELGEKEGPVHSLIDQHPRPEPASASEEVPLAGGKVRIGAAQGGVARDRLFALLHRNADLFIWSLTDLGGVSRGLAEHMLDVRQKVHPMRQKFWSLRSERKEAAAAEVVRLKEAGFIRPVRYPKWLANVVMVRKSDAGWRMCVNFTDLNAA